MILADTSVWIDYFKKPQSPSAQKLDSFLGKTEIVVGDLILVEILQGLRDGSQLQQVRSFLEPFRVVSLCGPQIAHIAAENYRKLRRAGTTIRGTIDVIIATWCIENDALLVHSDRDFESMKDKLGLEVV